MIFKKYFLYFILIFSFLTYLSVVYSNFNKDINISFVWVLSKNMYADNDTLNNNLVIFKSNNDISNYVVAWSCVWESKFLRNQNDFYFFEFKVIKNCLNKNFYLKNDNKILIQTRFEVNLFTKWKIVDTLTDYTTVLLLKLQKKIALEKNRFSLFASIDNTNKNIDFIQKARYLKELEYKEEIINHIIKKRQDKYNIPVLWYSLPTKNLSKLPNASRYYRSGYTFWVHEWWDIDTKLWQEVIAIDDWVIVRIVDNFKWDDFWKIKKWEDLTYIDKINNLDILRWNQVWLKTMKGDVIFYWHLDTVNKDIKVWDFISSKTPLWTVGISWIPDKNYNDYHLHFEIRKNPYLNSKVWKNTYLDYMRWDWYFKGKNFDYIINNQYNIFNATN